MAGAEMPAVTRSVVVALVAGLVVAGCSRGEEGVSAQPATTASSGGQVSSAVPSSRTSATGARSTASTPAPTAQSGTQGAPTGPATGGLTADPTEGPRTKKVGATTVYSDQSAITITRAEAWTTPSGTPATRVTFTVLNKATYPVDLMFWYIEALVDDQVVPPISGEGLAEPSGELGAGQHRQFTMAFPRRPGQGLQVRVTWRDGFPFTYNL